VLRALGEVEIPLKPLDLLSGRVVEVPLVNGSPSPVRPVAVALGLAGGGGDILLGHTSPFYLAILPNRGQE
jgi:hypothetical protein